jgi:hypothetical protein
MALTPVRKLLPVPESGLETMLHAAPFQCSIKVWLALTELLK